MSQNKQWLADLRAVGSKFIICLLGIEYSSAHLTNVLQLGTDSRILGFILYILVTINLKVYFSDHNFSHPSCSVKPKHLISNFSRHVLVWNPLRLAENIIDMPSYTHRN